MDLVECDRCGLQSKGQPGKQCDKKHGLDKLYVVRYEMTYKFNRNLYQKYVKEYVASFEKYSVTYGCRTCSFTKEGTYNWDKTSENLYGGDKERAFLAVLGPPYRGAHEHRCEGAFRAVHTAQGSSGSATFGGSVKPGECRKLCVVCREKCKVWGSHLHHSCGKHLFE